MCTSCNIWDIHFKSICFYLKLKFNWVSCISSGNSVLRGLTTSILITKHQALATLGGNQHCSSRSHNIGVEITRMLNLEDAGPNFYFIGSRLCELEQVP